MRARASRPRVCWGVGVAWGGVAWCGVLAADRLRVASILWEFVETRTLRAIGCELSRVGEG